jgi:hypothetical protein
MDHPGHGIVAQWALLWTVLFVSVALPLRLLAQPNDFCSNAQVVSVGAIPFDSTCAGRDGSASCGSGGDPGGHDLWFSFTPQVSGPMTFDTQGTSFDTILSIYGMCYGTELACNDDYNFGGGSAFQSRVDLSVVADVRYLVRVAGFSTHAGPGVLNISVLPANSCASAPTIIPGVYLGTTAGATLDGIGLCATQGGGAPDVWYAFTAPADGRLSVNTCGSFYDSVVGIHSTSCGSHIACNTECAGSPCGSPHACTSAVLSAGQSVRIRIGGQNGQSGRYVLNVVFENAPSNDTCAGAIVLAPGTTTFSNAAATTGTNFGGPQACDTMQSDLWFRYTAPCDTPISLSTCGSSFDTKLAVYTVCPTAPSQFVACSDDGPACPPQSEVTYAGTIGATHLIRVGSKTGGATGAGQITVTVPSAMPNDLCTLAQPIEDGTFVYSHCLTTGSTGIDEGCGFDASTIDVWFRYAPPATTTVTVSLCGSPGDTRLAVYGANCPSNPNGAIACNDNACGTAASLQFAATVGRQYLIRIGRLTSSAGSYAGTVTISSDASCIGDVDDGSATGTPDGGVGIEDLLYYLARYDAGC